MASGELLPEDEVMIKEFSVVLRNRKVPLCCLVKGDHLNKLLADFEKGKSDSSKVRAEFDLGKMCSECLSSIVTILADMLKKNKQKRKQMQKENNER